MKKSLLALATTLTLSLSAFAGEITFFQRSTRELYQVAGVRTEFAFNEELGRAWVIIKFDQVSEGPVYYDERAKVPGLSYDRDSKEIILEAEGQRIVCANVKKNFLGTQIRPTGACEFKEKTVEVVIDNGYELEKIEFLKLSLIF